MTKHAPLAVPVVEQDEARAGAGEQALVPTPERVLALQRAAGNRAVRSLVARQPGHERPSRVAQAASTTFETVNDNVRMLLYTLADTARERATAARHVERALASADEAAALAALREAGLRGTEAELRASLEWLRTARALSSPAHAADPPAPVVGWASSWARRLASHPASAPAPVASAQGGHARNVALGRPGATSPGRFLRGANVGFRAAGGAIGAANVVGGGIEVYQSSGRAAEAVERGDYASGVEAGATAAVAGANMFSGGVSLAAALGAQLPALGPAGAVVGAFATGYAIGTVLVLPFLTEIGVVPADSRSSSAASRAAGTGPVFLESVATDVAEETRPLVRFLRELGNGSRPPSTQAAIASAVQAAVVAVPAQGDPPVVDVRIPESLNLPQGARFRLARRDVWRVVRLCELVASQGDLRVRERER